MIKKRHYPTIFVIFLIISPTLTIVASEMDKRLIDEQKHDTEYYWWGMCIVIGTFSQKSIDDKGYIDRIVTNNTNGIAWGLLRNNDNPSEMPPRILLIRNMKVSISIPCPYSCGYIGNNFMFVISKSCDMR